MNMALKKQFAQQYADTAVETSVSEASPHQLVAMLYEGLIRNLTLTRVFMEQKNYEKKALHLNKALSIITGLKAGLDFEKGGDVAGNLFDLYDYCYRKSFDASVQNDTALINEVITLIKEVEDAWKQMPDNIKRVSKEQIDRMSA